MLKPLRRDVLAPLPRGKRDAERRPVVQSPVINVLLLCVRHRRIPRSDHAVRRKHPRDIAPRVVPARKVHVHPLGRAHETDRDGRLGIVMPIAYVQYVAVPFLNIRLAVRRHVEPRAQRREVHDHAHEPVRVEHV